MCLAAAYWARVDDIYYGASAADAARVGFDDAFLYTELCKDSSPASSLPRSCWATKHGLALTHQSPRHTRSNTDCPSSIYGGRPILDRAPPSCVCCQRLSAVNGCR